MAKIRIYEAVNQMWARPTTQTIDSNTGATGYAAIDNPQNVLISVLNEKGFMVIGGKGLSSKSDGYAIIESEGSNGSKMMARQEYADVGGQNSSEPFNIFIDNTSKSAAIMSSYYGTPTPLYSAATQKVVLFDGVGLLKRFLGQSASNPLTQGVHFGGDFLKETYLQYAQTTQSIPLDFHAMVLTINTPNLFNQLQIETAEAKPNGTTPKSTKINVSGRVTSADTNNTVRRIDEFRFQANGLTGIILTIPAEATLSINMNNEAIGKVFGMMK